MEVWQQHIEEGKWTQYISNFTFYWTHPVTVNTSTVTYMTHFVSAGNMDYRGRTACFSWCCSCCWICRRKQYISFAVIIGIISVTVIGSIKISYLLIDKTFVFYSALGFSGSGYTLSNSLMHKIITTPRFKITKIKSTWHNLFTEVRQVAHKPDIQRSLWPMTRKAVPQLWT